MASYIVVDLGEILQEEKGWYLAFVFYFYVSTSAALCLRCFYIGFCKRASQPASQPASQTSDLCTWA